MRTDIRPRTALLVALIALACTGGSFTCKGSSGDHHDPDDKVIVDGSVRT
jgi:hypothetical protein